MIICLKFYDWYIFILRTTVLNTDHVFRLRIRPKCLVGVSNFNIRTKVLGQDVSMPVGISPTAMQRMAHPEGELASARGNLVIVK